MKKVFWLYFKMKFVINNPILTWYNQKVFKSMGGDFQIMKDFFVQIAGPN